MSILSTNLPHGFGRLTQSMIQTIDLPRNEVLDCSIIADAFEDDCNAFEKADEDVFAPHWNQAKAIRRESTQISV